MSAWHRALPLSVTTRRSRTLDRDAARVEPFGQGELAEDLLLDAGVGKPVAGGLARFGGIFLLAPGCWISTMQKSPGCCRTNG